MNKQTSTPARSARACLKLASLLALASPILANAQSAPATESATDAPIVELSAFEVNERGANPYQASQAVSSSRIAMDIQNIPQTISVVTSQLMEDTLGQKMLDTAKYVTPVVESTLPFGGDRYMIRGYMVSHEFIDGMEISGADGYSMSLAQYNIDRVEVIKGPNAILVPGGSPGGQMNPITKSPLMKDQGSVTLELAQYAGNAISADENKVLNREKGIAMRVVAALWRNDHMYIKNQYRNGWMLAPSMSFKLGENHKLVVKGEIVQNRETNLGGLPIDPAVGSKDVAYIARGLPRDWSFGNDEDSRHRGTERLTAELTSKLGEHVTSRLQVAANHVRRIDVGGTSAAIKFNGTAFNPTIDVATGLYTPVLSNIPDPSTWIYTRNSGKVDLEYDELHFKNDYVAKFETSWVKSNTVAGIAANSSKVRFISWPAASRPELPANNLAGITYPNYTWVYPSGSSGTDRTGKQVDMQAFLYENLSFLKDRVIVSGGVSRFRGKLDRVDNSGVGTNLYPHYKMLDTAKTAGVVGKVTKEVSLFYGYNTSGGTMPGSLNAGNYAPSLRVAEGNQHEWGVKTSLLGGRLTASVSHFQIKQSNYPVTNSVYYTMISQGITPPADFPSTLYLDLNSKGWEFEGTFALNKEFTVIGNYTAYEMRVPVTNVRPRAVPDHAAGLYIDYRVASGPVKGLGFNLGIDYKGDVAGENASGYTQTTTPPFVAKQPTFLIGGRTVVNVGMSYRAKDWTARLTLANALDRDYLLAAGSRTSAIAAEPRNVRGSITYHW